MIYLAGFVGILMVLTAEARVGSSSQSELCTETDQCLMFDLICEAEDYEVRHYSSVKWVSTEETSWFMQIAAMTAFRRLYDYIKEYNINMTAPVLMKVPDKPFFMRGTYTMMFLLPIENQANPPTPSNDKVNIVQMPAMKVYAKGFNSMLFTLAHDKEASDLSSDLNKVGAEYINAYHYFAAYNGPMTFRPYNEVWFVLDDDPVCPGSSEEDS